MIEMNYTLLITGQIMSNLDIYLNKHKKIKLTVMSAGVSHKLWEYCPLLLSHIASLCKLQM